MAKKTTTPKESEQEISIPAPEIEDTIQAPKPDDAIQDELKAKFMGSTSQILTDPVLLVETKERAAAIVNENGSIDQKIMSFLASRGTGAFVRINDFLKSLYPISKNNEPVEWQKQTVMKSLRAILDGMVAKREILTSNNSYLMLGKPYWPDDTTGKTHYHHLGTLNIEAKLP